MSEVYQAFCINTKNTNILNAKSTNVGTNHQKFYDEVQLNPLCIHKPVFSDSILLFIIGVYYVFGTENGHQF